MTEAGVKDTAQLILLPTIDRVDRLAELLRLEGASELSITPILSLVPV